MYFYAHININIHTTRTKNGQTETEMFEETLFRQSVLCGRFHFAYQKELKFTKSNENV